MTNSTERHEYRLVDLLDRIGLEYDERTKKMDCPFCHSQKTIGFDFENNIWNCFKCPAHGGVKHMFAYYVKGWDYYPTTRRAKAILSRELSEFMGDAVMDISPMKTQPQRPKLRVASDDHLNEVYEAMARIPALALRDNHKENLLKRGLTEEVIQRNGYRSIPDKMFVPDCYLKMYEDAGGEYRRSHIKGLEYSSAKAIRFGLMIANTLLQQGHDLQGVPGFYKFGAYWCFWCLPGILIPTRNMKGQIVIWQVRTVDKKGSRYLTLSKGGLPGHVEAGRGKDPVTGKELGISRCHFPLGNAPLYSAAPFIVTEGPLKADVACHLYGSPVSFVAIPGVKTTSDLLYHASAFLEAGRSEILNGLDMDRLTNPNVRNGSNKLVQDFAARGITVLDMFWGTSYATTKYLMLSAIARHRNVQVTFPPDQCIHQRLGSLVVSLEKAGIVTCITQVDNDGNEHTYHWDPKTKGIDDYLFNR